MPTVAEAFGFKAKAPTFATLRILLPCCPYGVIRYHGAPADLRDIPLGTVIHVRGFLPPDPAISVSSGAAR